MIRALAVIALLASCKQAKEPAAASEVLAKSRALAAAMCACKDKACATSLRTQWQDLTAMLHGAELTDEQVEGLATEDDRFSRCMTAIAPSTP
jgi:hypothetical protein